MTVICSQPRYYLFAAHFCLALLLKHISVPKNTKECMNNPDSVAPVRNKKLKMLFP